jgi:hypothetical protein
MAVRQTSARTRPRLVLTFSQVRQLAELVADEGHGDVRIEEAPELGSRYMKATVLRDGKPTDKVQTLFAS